MMEITMRKGDELLIKSENNKDKYFIQCGLVNNIIVSKC